MKQIIYLGSNLGNVYAKGEEFFYEFKKVKNAAKSSAGLNNNVEKQFVDEYNNPEYYRLELPSSNRGHQGEDATGSYLGE